MYIVISDTHIGDRHANKNLPKLFNLLEDFSSYGYTLILNGDILDFSKFMGFDKRHRTFISLISKFKGVIYIEGNHDWFISGLKNCISGIEFVKKYVVKVNNKIIKIFHGHERDPWICHFPRFVRVLTKLNRWFYEWSGINFQQKLDKSWILRKLTKRQEKKLIRKEQDANSLIVGHTHKPCIMEFENTVYCNTGDWIEEEHCSYAIINNIGEVSLYRCK